MDGPLLWVETSIRQNYYGLKLPWDLNVFDEISIRCNYNGKYLHGVESSGYETSWEVTSSAKLLGLKIT